MSLSAKWEVLGFQLSNFSSQRNSISLFYFGAYLALGEKFGVWSACAEIVFTTLSMRAAIKSKEPWWECLEPEGCFWLIHVGGSLNWAAYSHYIPLCLLKSYNFFFSWTWTQYLCFTYLFYVMLGLNPMPHMCKQAFHHWTMAPAQQSCFNILNLIWLFHNNTEVAYCVCTGPFILQWNGKQATRTLKQDQRRH